MLWGVDVLCGPQPAYHTTNSHRTDASTAEARPTLIHDDWGGQIRHMLGGIALCASLLGSPSVCTSVSHAPSSDLGEVTSVALGLRTNRVLAPQLWLWHMAKSTW